MENLKLTELNWEQSGNGIFVKGQYTNIATVTPCGDRFKTEAIAKLMAASPQILKSLLYAKSLIDILEQNHPEIAHKLMGVDEMIEIENVINELNS